MNPEKENQPQWIPIQTTYNKERVVAEFLKTEKIEYYIPMMYQVENDAPNSCPKLVPAIHNLLFIHHPYSREWCYNLQNRTPVPIFYLKKERNGKEFCTIEHQDMQNFIRATDPTIKGTRFIDPEIIQAKKGDKVRILRKGPLFGIIGKFVRYGGRHYIAVQVTGSSALLKVSHAWCEKINTEEDI